MAGYEILVNGMKPFDAIHFIREKRPGSIETVHQEEMLFNLYNQLYPHDRQSFVASENNFQNFHKKLYDYRNKNFNNDNNNNNNNDNEENNKDGN